MNRIHTALLGVGLLLAGSAAQAQGTHVKGTIPFNFVVGNQVLPAGEYEVTSESFGSPAILIRSDDGKASASLAMTISCSSYKPADKTKLVFHIVAGQYFLSQIWTQGNDRGRELRKSRAEVQLAKNNNASSEIMLEARLIR
jgi:hypothetical protein